MKKNSFILLAGALILAVGVALLARTLLAPPPPKEIVQAAPPAPAIPPAKEVLIAVRDLGPGDFIDTSALGWRKVGSDADTSRLFLRGSVPQEFLHGATLRQPVSAGQILDTALVVRPGEPGFLAAVLAPGMRAMSVPTSPVESSFGLVSPGDRVDVILGLRREDSAVGSGAPHLAAQTILRDVRVLALNNQASSAQIHPEEESRKESSGSFKFKTVTLEVPPHDAERLAVAKEVGSLQLALRPVGESGDIDDGVLGPVTTLRAATGLFASSATGAPASVQAFRGVKSETISLSAQ